MTNNAKETNRTLENAALEREAVVDSTAPHKQLVQELLQRERFSKAYRFYHQLMGQRKNPLSGSDLHYQILGYPLKHFKDGWNGSISNDYFEQFHFRSTMPKIITKMRYIEKSDPVTAIIRAKYDWRHDNIEYRKSFYKACGDKIDQQLTEDVMECPKFLIELAARLEDDPDPNFDDSYNWYYAGNGNLQLVCVNGVDYLLHSEFTTVYLSRFCNQNVNVEEKYTASFDCGKDMYILETICSPNNIVAVRTKSTIFIMKIIENDNDLCFEKLKHLDSESAFTGISFDKHHPYILYAVTIDSKLTIVNLNAMAGRSVKLKRNSDTLLNNWNCVIGVERCTYMHVEPDALSLYDKRTNSCVSKWNGVKQMVDTVHCNNITVAKHCEDSPSLYFATYHHAFLMDTRATKKRNLKAVQRWTHGLKCAPSYMSIVKADNNKELITVSSQWCEDTCVISNYADSVLASGEGQGVTMPYHPPNILNVMGEARLKMLCFDIHSPIDVRITTSTTGQVVIEQGENFSILTHNSLGDIFARHLYPEHMEQFVEDDSVQKLHDWSQSYKVERKIFEVSGLRNISELWRKVKKVPDSYNFGPKNTKQYYDESKLYEAFEKEEVIPELLDAWKSDRSADDINTDDQSLMLNLQYEDSDDD